MKTRVSANNQRNPPHTRLTYQLMLFFCAWLSEWQIPIKALGSGAGCRCKCTDLWTIQSCGSGSAPPVSSNPICVSIGVTLVARIGNTEQVRRGLDLYKHVMQFYCDRDWDLVVWREWEANLKAFPRQSSFCSCIHFLSCATEPRAISCNIAAEPDQYQYLHTSVSISPSVPSRCIWDIRGPTSRWNCWVGGRVEEVGRIV